ncbi:hypothetical protein BKG92_10115 [Rodentibacter ratti]|uniref:HNH endonuclease 5 domain-containing protein n=1 Tax=Rodentibacter ratti TaxID=1906745 RepID=A0A1V3KT33_9PAST|nr:HNH endonuclease [Rodentibacter ratti]OOF80854.1 hypothetical protein BKG92_10115 [Rodentibacter ratti]
MVCIICRKEKEEMSREHVIPDSLGGNFVIETVCKACNSKLGHSIDVKFLNHNLIILYRQKYGLKGKTKKIPELPMTGRVDVLKDGIIQRKALSKKNNEGKLDLYSIPAINELLELGEEEYVKITLEQNLLDFKLGFLKMAYEFAVTTVDGYFNSPNAKKLSKILLDLSQRVEEIDKGILEYIDQSVSFVKKLSCIEEFICKELDLNLNMDNVQIIACYSGKSGTYCEIKLHNHFKIFQVFVNLGSEPLYLDKCTIVTCLVNNPSEYPLHPYKWVIDDE